MHLHDHKKALVECPGGGNQFHYPRSPDGDKLEYYKIRFFIYGTDRTDGEVSTPICDSATYQFLGQ